MEETTPENTMNIDLRELEEVETIFTFEQTASDLDLKSGELTFVGPIRTTVRIHKLNDSLSASGASRYQIQTNCARCNEGIELPFEVEFSFVFQKGKPRGIEGDEDETLIWLENDSNMLDLGQEVRDYILLEIPINPVCEAYESGTCPNLEEVEQIEEQASGVNEVDTRWDALRSIKSDD
ncbi:MAG: DUF177 domain-containing protein [Candidatus Latescibacterota bacterium]|nr:DUF177 domain-containing protein [Candidatus Latescibacterota bacterium]